jgi:5-methylcytosine-specific restriction protein A
MADDDQIATEATGKTLSKTNGYSSLAAGLQRVMDEYADAVRQGFAGHPLANFIRSDLKQLVLSQLDAPKGSFVVKGSCGQGAWARGPWVGIFDPIITTSAQSGYYGCFLFREDMKGVYLTLTQAVTEAKRAYRADARTALKARAAHFRAMLGSDCGRFSINDIDLTPSNRSNDTSFYEAGTICATFYPSGSIPDNTTITADLRALVALYERLASSDVVVTTVADEYQSLTSGIEFEDASRRRLHERIERNQRLVNKVKEAHGSTCQACGLNFKEFYGELGDGYIEAHHLRPMSTLAKARVEMDPVQDFAVLCSNCHRMIHRSEHVSDVENFKAAHIHQMRRNNG